MSAAVPQCAKAAALWKQWKDTHGMCCQALSSAANIADRLELLSDGQVFEVLGQHPVVQQQVVEKQLTSFNKALAIIHSNHDVLKGIVKDMERLHVEASRILSPATSLEAVAIHQGPQPSVAECVELLHDMWMMCRNELLMKFAAVGLITLGIKPPDMAALLLCYQDQPNIDVGEINSKFALLQEVSQPKQKG